MKKLPKTTNSKKIKFSAKRPFFKRPVVLIVAVAAFVLIGTFAVIGTKAAGVPKDNWGCPLFPSASQYPVLSYGSTGPCVKRVQELLNWDLWADAQGSHLAIDGSYGPNTTNDVKWYQAVRHITSDGVTGPRTWYELLCAYSWYAPGQYITPCHFTR